MSLVKWVSGFFILSILCGCDNNNTKSQTSNFPVVKNSTVNSKPAITTAKEDPVSIINVRDNPIVLQPHAIHLQKGIDLSLNIPQGYNISIAFEGLNRLRFLTKSPDGKLFATDMFDRSDNRKGKVYLFDNWDDSTRQFKKIYSYLSGLHNPNQVAFYNDSGKAYLYVCETGALNRYVYQAGDTIATGKPVLIASFPDYGLSYKYGGWHLTRSIAIHNNKLYVSVGSSCNACIEKETVRATILEMNPDGSDKKIFATGLRNAVGIGWIGNELWATSMGRDLIGPDKPEDLFQQIEQGKFYGWPYYIQYQNKMYADAAMQDSARRQNVIIPPPPPIAFAGFKAHTAPLGFHYFEGFNDTALNHAVLVALHGSTSVWRQRGNAIVKILGGNRYVDIVSGFLTGKTEAERKGRPCDVMMNNANSFFFTDDLNGVLYYVWKSQ